MVEPFKVRVVNPGKKKRRKVRNKKGQFVKKGSSRRRRRPNGSSSSSSREANPRRRRRRRSSNPAPSRRRRRRRNPEGGGGGFNARSSFDLKSLLPYGLATLAQAFTVRKWGDTWGVGVLGPAQLAGSGYRGQAWTLKNYLIAGATGWLGAKLIARTRWGSHAAAIFWRTSIENIFTRLVWTEFVARSAWGQQYFGAMPEGQPGQVFDDGRGNRFLMAANGQWVSMQGVGGYGELVQAGPLGYGELVRAGPLGQHAGGYMPLGHLLDEGTSDDRNEMAQQLGLGSRDPFAAALQAA
jgi:hypothetical protein